MKLGYVIIYTPDVGASVDFYERTFGLQRRFVHESGTYAEMETGATALAFAAESLADISVPGFRKNRREDAPAGVEVALVSEGIEQRYQHALDNGAIGVLAPTVKPWGQVVAYVRDNNGVLVELATPMG